jgi:desulfoferrodoxin (superoxide reductase-like protein)
MKFQKSYLFLIILFMGGLIFANMAFGNQPSVTIEAPADVSKESEIIIRVTIAHSANNFFHHVEWMEIRVNDQQVVWREYSYFHLPEDGTYTIELEHTVNEETQIRAEASCNLHGSRGPTFYTVSAK